MGFKKTVEDFTCERCGFNADGSGYTNHCPRCLWSKHVDAHPGDRAEKCGGLMEPMRVEGGSPEYSLVHKCARCGCEKRNKLCKEDDVSAVVALVEKRAARDN